jgi:hydantoinase/carbamoylase family amidase
MYCVDKYLRVDSEEGARFPKSMVASGVWAGAIAIEDAYALADIADPNATQGSELKRIGFIGDVPCSSEANPLGAHFELHIEQGPILEGEKKKIGVVQGAQAYKWLTFTITGRDAHTGTTPLYMRSDPMLATCKMISTAHEIAKRRGGLASTGILKTPTNSSTNTIMSQVSFSLDIRHPEDSVVAELLEACLDAFKRIAKEEGRGVQIKWTLDTDSPAVKFDRDCIQAVQTAAESLVGPNGWLPLTSGAGHDSVYTSRHCPTTMIFVPCRDGVSHHPEEYCAPEDW